MGEGQNVRNIRRREWWARWPESLRACPARGRAAPGPSGPRTVKFSGMQPIEIVAGQLADGLQDTCRDKT